MGEGILKNYESAPKTPETLGPKDKFRILAKIVRPDLEPNKEEAVRFLAAWEKAGFDEVTGEYEGDPADFEEMYEERTGELGGKIDIKA